MARKIGRAAGPSRDLDVTLALLEETARAPEWDSPETRLLRRRLRAARRRRRHAMSEGLLDLDIARFREDLRRIQGRGGETLFATVSRLRRFRDAEGNGTLALLEEIGDRFDPVRLHRFRARARRLRYAAEVSAELRGIRTEAPKRLKRIQERLGAMHDAFVLSEWLGGQSEVAHRGGRSALSSMARRLQAEFMRISQQHHRAFLEEDPAGTVRQALAEMFRADSAA
jgi:CHAD domain-containing protein